MTVIEFVDAVDAMLDAAIKWIMLGSAIATLVGLLVAWAVTRVVKWAWRAARHAWGSTAPRTTLDAPLPPELPTSDPSPPGTADRHSAPQWAHVDKEAA